MAKEKEEGDKKEGMSEAEAVDKIAEGGTVEDPAKAKAQLRKKRIMIFGTIGVLVLLLLGVGGFLMFGNKKGETPKEVEKSKESVEKTLYIDLEDFIVNLTSANPGQSRFLKMSVSMEVGSDKDKNEVIANMPKIRDSFQVYLRELRPEDFKGSQTLFRIREELLYRINKLIYPTLVKDILFNEIIVQ